MGAPDAVSDKSVAPAAEETRPAAPDLAPVYAAVARYFGLLADPTRLRILNAICHRELCVSEIVGATGASQTNVSRHLALLHDARVVSRRRVGSSVFYRVADPGFPAICRMVCDRIADRIEDGQPLRADLREFVAAH
jgi:DNA-binding transcriptional ArsR family regulator